MRHTPLLSLRGQRILITRPARQSGELESLLRSHGAEPRVCPLIQIQPLDRDPQLLALLQCLSAFDGLVLSSRNGVESLASALCSLQLDPVAALAGLQLAAVGPQTAAALTQLARRPVAVPPEARAERLADLLCAQGVAGQRWLYLRAVAAREILAERLRQAGAEVTEQPVYETLPPDPASIQRLQTWLERAELDVLIFASPSAVQHFVTHLPAALRRQALARCQIVAIGPVTAAATQALLGRVDRQADSASPHGLLTALQAVCHV